MRQQQETAEHQDLGAQGGDKAAGALNSRLLEGAHRTGRADPHTEAKDQDENHIPRKGGK